MPGRRISITIDPDLLARLDQLVIEHPFPSRSQAVHEAIGEMLRRSQRNRFAHECAKLDRVFEKALAAEGLAADFEKWPDY